MSTTTDPDEGTTETWTYIGRRGGYEDGKPAHVFLDPSGKSRAFNGKVIRHPAIGGRYTLTVWHREEGRISANFDSVRYAGMHDDAEDMNRWRAEAMAAEQEVSANQAAARLARDNGDIGAITLHGLRDIMRRQPPHLRRGTLAAINEWLLRP